LASQRAFWFRTISIVMAGPVPAIHGFGAANKIMDARHKFTLGPAEGRTRVAGHDRIRTVHLVFR